MTLKTLFAVPIVVILVVTMSLAGMLTGQGWSSLERGKIAVGAVERMRLLIDLQTDLRAERTITNFAFGNPYPLPEPVKRRLADARAETDRELAAVGADMWAAVLSSINETRPNIRLASVEAQLAAIRALTDALLVSGPGARTFSALGAVMPGLLAVSQSLDDAFERASLAVTAADPKLSGLVTEDRLVASLRNQVGVIAALVLPRINAGETLTSAELLQLQILLAEASKLTQLLGSTIEIAGATPWIRTSFTNLKAMNVDQIFSRLRDQMGPELPDTSDGARPLLAQRLLIPWGERINALRSSIVAAMVDHVAVAAAEHEWQFDLVLAAFGAILVAMLESVVLLSGRVVRPLADLGLAITRIATGDRSVPLALHSGTREITEMVTAVETLRQAALIADATAMRRRMAARQRMLSLRVALGIAQTVREPALELERGVARLCEGIDATIALVTSGTRTPPATLGVAADAIRAGLAAMRDSAADLDATFAAAGSAQEEDRPEAEFVAHISAVRAQVDRRDKAVRGFVHPSLVALRDATSAPGHPPGPALRDLVSHQFERIEQTVGTVASMLAAVTQASAMVRDLPLDDTPMAA